METERKVDADAVKRSVLFIPWCIALFGNILIFSGLTALQADCDDSRANAITIAGSAGYFSPMSCSRFYAFSWFIMSMLLFIVVLTPLLLVLRGLSRFRVGIASLVAIQIMLLMDMANSFLYFNSIPTITGVLLSRGRVVIAGSITAAVALFTMLILLGLRNENSPALLQSKTGEPAHSPDATRGGLYQPTENPEEQVRYYNPVSVAPSAPRG